MVQTQKHLDAKPPKNLQYLLFLINEMEEVRGKVKLFKLHFLIEKDAHVLLDKPFETYDLGPVDYATYDYALDNDLINEEAELPKECHIYTLTNEGKKYFSKYCEPRMLEKEKKKALKIIKKFGSKTGTELVEYIHERYVDEFKDAKNTKKILTDLSDTVEIYQDLILKTETENEIEKDDQETLYDSFFHIKEILSAVSKRKDATERGVVITTIYELYSNLAANNYNNDPYTKELVDFIDNYCHKQGILPSMYSDDLADLKGEERTRIVKAIKDVDKTFS